MQWRSLEEEHRRGGKAKPACFGFRSEAERCEARGVGNAAGGEPPVTVASNVKHQRARATASRENERSRCARSAACASSTPSSGRAGVLTGQGNESRRGHRHRFESDCSCMWKVALAGGNERRQ